MADTSFEFIVSWFEKAAKTAKTNNKNDSAKLWEDGLQHLVELHEENRCLYVLIGRYTPTGEITKKDIEWAKSVISH